MFEKLIALCKPNKALDFDGLEMVESYICKLAAIVRWLCIIIKNHYL